MWFNTITCRIVGTQLILTRRCHRRRNSQFIRAFPDLSASIKIVGASNAVAMTRTDGVRRAKYLINQILL